MPGGDVMTNKELADRLRKLSAEMVEIATAMHEFPGIQHHAEQLIGASNIALTWVEGLTSEDGGRDGG